MPREWRSVRLKAIPVGCFPNRKSAGPLSRKDDQIALLDFSPKRKKLTGPIRKEAGACLRMRSADHASDLFPAGHS
jgi:hypothetical protein